MKFYLFILTCLLLIACNNNSSTLLHTPKGTPIGASGYSRIISDLGADINIEMNADSPYRCYLQCEKEIEPLIVFDIVNDELHIRTADHTTINTHKPIVINMRVRDLKSVRNNGSGNIVIGGTLQSAHFDIDNTGSGNVNVKDIRNREMSVNSSGSGDVTLAGTTKNLLSRIKGSGNISAFALQAETADAAITGSGNMETSVSSTLDADIVGSGNIYYKGKPSIRNSITGSGLISAR